MLEELRSPYYLGHSWSPVRCCNLSGGVALNVWFTTNGMYVKNNTIINVARASNNKRDCDAWTLLLLAAAVRSFAHMPLGISDRNSGVITQRQNSPGNNVGQSWCYCCKLSGGVALIVWFTTNGMCAKNNTIICVARTSNNKRDAWSLLLLAATVWSFAHMPLGISDCNSGVITQRQNSPGNNVGQRDSSFPKTAELSECIHTTGCCLVT